MSSLPPLGPVDPLQVRLESSAKVFFSADPVKNFTPYILGMWFDAIMLGCFICLFAEWRRNSYVNERPFIKILMFHLLFVSCGISCYVLARQLHLFAAGFGVYRNFLDPSYYRVFWILNPISRAPAAAFFSHRAWLSSGRSIWIPLTVIPLLTVSVGCSFAAFHASQSIPIKLDSMERVFVTIFVVTELAVDVINTLTIAVGLYKSRTGWSMTDSLVSHLLVLLAQTQLPPTLAAMGFLVCFLGFPNQTIIAIFTCVAKIHVLCLVVVLNSRSKVTTLACASESYPMKQNGPKVTDMPSSEFNQMNAVIHVRSEMDPRGITRTATGRTIAHGDDQQFASQTSLIHNA